MYRPSCRSFSLMSCLTVSFSCVVYSRGNRTPESEKKQTSLGPVLSGCKNLFSEIKNKNKKPINAKICFFSLIGHVGTRAIFSKSTAADKNTAGRVRGKSNHVLPSSACSAVRLHKAGGAMLAARATRAQRAHRLATFTKRVSVLLDVLAL